MAAIMERSKSPQQCEPGSEKTHCIDNDASPSLSTSPTCNPNVSRWNGIRSILEELLEFRGISRVLPEEKQSLQQRGYAHMMIVWLSFNLTANNITLGMLGPALFELSFLDSSMCAVSGAIVGSMATAYITTFGPRSGCRTMVFARYIMGWYGVKLIVLLNIIVMLGYAVINVVVAGQILNAVSDHSLSIIVGIILVSVMTWVISTFGHRVFHSYEKYAWLPQLVVFSILFTTAGPNFDLNYDPSRQHDLPTSIGHRISFFSLNLAAAITYAGGAGDYFVYYPTASSSVMLFCATSLGLILSFTFSLILGIGLGSGLSLNASWSEAYNVSQGALIVEGFKPLGPWGSVCGTLVAGGLIANLIPATYSAGIDFQTLGAHFTKVPRIYWNSASVLVYTVAAIAGRENLASILTNFLALMGYWVSIWMAIVIEEHWIFHHIMPKPWDWEKWNDRHALPMGAAAAIAFAVGWIGASLGMAQAWYIAPIARCIGHDGADIGSVIGFLCCAIFYPPMRWLEIRYSHR